MKAAKAVRMRALLALSTLLAVGAAGAVAAQDGGSTHMPMYTLGERPPVPQVTPYPGLGLAYDYSGFRGQPVPVTVPQGFTPIFNGKDLTGWHISKTSRHGHTPDFHVLGGLLVSTQSPVGGGGLLITDKKYKNYEITLEAKADWGADSGIFVRTTEDGSAYQITLDYLPGGSMGRVISEGGLVGVGLPAGQTARPAAVAAPAAPAANATPRVDPGMAAWKPNDWNTVRVRVEGDVPHFQVWINDVKTADLQEAANHAVDGMVAGPIALQVHGGPVRWLTGDFWRWRNIGIKELP